MGWGKLAAIHSEQASAPCQLIGNGSALPSRRRKHSCWDQTCGMVWLLRGGFAR